MKKIAVDIDSTLHHYWDLFAQVVRRRCGLELSYHNQRSWQIPALGADELADCVAETHSQQNILNALPYPGAVETVRDWHQRGHFIQVTSHRSTHAQPATERWLAHIGLDYDELYCSFDKISRCVQLGIDILVDDSPVNIARALDAGIVAATLAHPWNEHLQQTPGVICADSWPELARVLEPALR